MYIYMEFARLTDQKFNYIFFTVYMHESSKVMKFEPQIQPPAMRRYRGRTKRDRTQESAWAKTPYLEQRETKPLTWTMSHPDWFRFRDPKFSWLMK